MVKLLKTEGDVVAGTYRFKQDEVKYMSCIYVGRSKRPVVRGDGCMKADRVPAGFLKVTMDAVERFAEAYPRLVSYKADIPTVHLFDHGVWRGHFWGEDYRFSMRWRAIGGKIWLIPDLDLDHNDRVREDGTWKVYRGNFHEFMLRQPGGALEGK